MYIYVPDKRAANPPILVAIHYCTGTAQAYFSGTQFKTFADQYGFIVVYPDAPDRYSPLQPPKSPAAMLTASAADAGTCTPPARSRITAAATRRRSRP